jgi:hypothetical protein
MTGTAQTETLQSGKMVNLNHSQEGLFAMSDEEFTVIIENPIPVKKAAEITGLKESRIQQLCREYQETEGISGLKSKKFGRDWQVERQSAEEYERSNRGPKPESD